MKSQLEKVEDLVKAEVNVKAIEYITDTEGFIKKKIKANFKVLGSKLGPKMKAMSAVITGFNQHEISTLEKEGSLPVNLDGELYTLLLIFFHNC